MHEEEHQKRDRDGEIFENDLTENRGADPKKIEEAQHHLKPDSKDMDVAPEAVAPWPGEKK